MFKALPEGFCREQVNPAYSSQTCPLCSFVDFKNHRAEVFKGRHCQHTEVADQVVALNYKNQNHSLVQSALADWKQNNLRLCRGTFMVERGNSRQPNGRQEVEKAKRKDCNSDPFSLEFEFVN